MGKRFNHRGAESTEEKNDEKLTAVRHYDNAFIAVCYGFTFLENANGKQGAERLFYECIVTPLISVYSCLFVILSDVNGCRYFKEY